MLLSTWTSMMDRRFCTPGLWARELAGSSATDCGEFRPTDDRARAIECMLRAQAEGHPATAMFWEQGIDSAVADLFVRTATGSTLMLACDSDRSGGLRFNPHLAQRNCSRFQEEKREMALNVKHSLECVEASAWVDICGSD